MYTIQQKVKVASLLFHNTDSVIGVTMAFNEPYQDTDVIFIFLIFFGPFSYMVTKSVITVFIGSKTIQEYFVLP